ncbi:MAG: hypothetical protein P8O79_01875 [Halieaceae bacterium]|nr:hypothetical protein [Halieaceae bacterium]
MAFYQVPAPDLLELTSAGATLHLLEPYGYSSDERLLLVRATYTELGSADLRYAFYVFDLTSQTYVASVNSLLAGNANPDSIDVSDAVIIGSQSDWTVYAKVQSLGDTASVLQSVSHAGTTVGDVVAAAVNAPYLVEVADFKISDDGRYLVVETRDEQLASDAIPDTNDQTEDVYLIDTQTQSVLRVSLAGGAEVQDPVYLQDLNVKADGTIEIALLTAASLVNPNLDANSTDLNGPIGSRDDAYLWTISGDASGWYGDPSIALVSIDITGVASGYVNTDYGNTVITEEGVLFSSASTELANADGNSASDVFVNTGNSVQRLTELLGDEYASGAVLLAANEAGTRIAVLTDSPEFGGVEGLNQIVLIDTLEESAVVVSSDGSLADNVVINGVLSNSGSTLAFTSLATNLVPEDPVATSGSLYINQMAVPLDGQIYHWSKHALMTDVTVNLNAVLSSGDIDLLVSTQTDSEGGFNLSALGVNDVSLNPSLAFDTSKTRSFINSSDALAALKIAVGLNPNPDPDGAGPLTAPDVSPYQFIAADVNQDGRVTSADALAILKMAVGLSSALPPEWLFVPQAQTFWQPDDQGGGSYTLDRSSVNWDEGILLDGVVPDDLDFVAVLLGDVNGSWSPPETATILPDDYFRQLELDGYGPAGKWAIQPIP